MRKIYGTVVGAAGAAPGTVIIDDAGRVAEITMNRVAGQGSDDIDADGYLIVPGFIDQHVHGGGGADFMDGGVDAVRQAVRAHARFGTTGLLATTLTASHDNTTKAVASIRNKVTGGRQDDEARILGIHLEGPFICRARCGAQPVDHIRKPDPSEFAEWLDVGAGLVRKITLAPEIPGAKELIQAARRDKVIVSIGHTDAKAEDVDTAIGWGASHATHIFNAMSGLHHRMPGATGALLASPKIVAELIADGIHLDPHVVRFVVAAKGLDRVILITDGISGAGMGNGDYELGGFKVIVADGKASLADGTLAGSVLTMNRAFINAWKFCALSPSDVVRITSTNAARELGMSELYGSIEPGRPADIAIISPDNGHVLATVINGRDAYRR
jgi:N-acetylglucosamine-6-phosphate deacetylase